jgi:hypothetical protein
VTYPIVPRGEMNIVNFFYKAPAYISRWCDSHIIFQNKISITARRALGVVAAVALAAVCLQFVVNSLFGRVTPHIS